MDKGRKSVSHTAIVLCKAPLFCGQHQIILLGDRCSLVCVCVCVNNLPTVVIDSEQPTVEFATFESRLEHLTRCTTMQATQPQQGSALHSSVGIRVTVRPSRGTRLSSLVTRPTTSFSLPSFVGGLVQW